SLITGLSALAFDWVSFALLRFLVGIAIGSEWSTGASLTAEVWPDHARGKGAGLMQCGLGIGFFVASFVWLFVSSMGPGAWRVMFLIGFLMSLTTTLAWWGISTWVPPYIGSVAANAGLSPQQWASYAGMAYNFG